MKIGLLNPWPERSAEHQIAVNIARTAARLGHSAIECRNTTELLAAAPDFVLAMSITQPKATDLPTYGLMYHPRGVILPQAAEILNVLTYDGYFTVTPTMRDFLEDLLFSTRRRPLLGDFFPTCDSLDSDETINFSQARLAYMGTNWDAKSDLGFARRAGLFHLLGRQPWMAIYGPPESWQFLTAAGRQPSTAYKGLIPFDGESALQAYRAAGAGLALYSAYHEADNTVSNRIFEISAAGAICITQRLPWVEEQFGESVLYLDLGLDEQAMAARIDQHLAWIHANPQLAASKAAAANEIFRSRFSLEVGLPRVFELHQRFLTERQQRRTRDPLVSVIVRAGGRPHDILRRALESIAAQHHDRVELVLVFYRDYDPAPALAGLQSRFEAVKILSSPGANRSKALWTGLAACTGEYVTVLDDDDEWMSDHLHSLIERMGPRRDLAIAGSLRHYRKPVPLTRGVEDVRRIGSLLPGSDADHVIGMVAQYPIQGVMFRRSLVDDWLLQDPRMDTAEDSYLMLSLLEQAQPAFTGRATAILHESADGSSYHEHPRRSEDLLRLHLRFLGHPFAAASRFIRPSDLKSQRISDPGVRKKDGVTEYLLPPGYQQHLGPESRWEPAGVDINAADVSCIGDSQMLSAQPLRFQVKQRAKWAYGATITCRFPDDRPYIVKVIAAVQSGNAGFGVLNKAENEFVYRVFVDSPRDSSEPLAVYLPITRPSEVGRLVVQMGDTDDPTNVTVEGITFLSPSRTTAADLSPELPTS